MTTIDSKIEQNQAQTPKPDKKTKKQDFEDKKEK